MFGPLIYSLSCGNFWEILKFVNRLIDNLIYFFISTETLGNEEST